MQSKFQIKENVKERIQLIAFHQILHKTSIIGKQFCKLIWWRGTELSQDMDLETMQNWRLRFPEEIGSIPKRKQHDVIIRLPQVIVCIIGCGLILI